MNFFELFDPTEGEYYNHGDKRKAFFKRVLRGVEAPFHWQFTEWKSTTGSQGVLYQKEFYKLTNKTFSFDEDEEERLERVTFGWNDHDIWASDQGPLTDLVESVCDKISEIEDNPEVVIFYDMTAFSSKVEGFNVVVDYVAI